MKAKTLLLIALIVSSVNFSIAQKANLKKDRHEFIARVNQPEEIAVGTYVAIQEFQAEAHARDYLNEVKEFGYNEIRLSHSANKKSWLVVFNSDNDIDKAKIIRDKYRQVNMFKDAWLLTVYE